MAEKKILIAEDERPLARALALKLKNSGLKAENVYDGEAALAALKDGKFDLLLLDLMMPKIDGFKVLETLKAQNNKMPIIVLSNLGQEEDLARARSLGAKHYSIKASTPLANILQQVKEILHI